MRNTITSKRFKDNSRREETDTIQTKQPCSFPYQMLLKRHPTPRGVGSPELSLWVGGKARARRPTARLIATLFLRLRRGGGFCFLKLQRLTDKSCFSLMSSRGSPPEGTAVFSLPDKNNWANIFRIRTRTRQTFTVALKLKPEGL